MKHRTRILAAMIALGLSSPALAQNGSVQVTISEGAIQRMLEAATPYNFVETFTYQFMFTPTVFLVHMALDSPLVRCEPGHVKVNMKFEAEDESQIVKYQDRVDFDLVLETRESKLYGVVRNLEVDLLGPLRVDLARHFPPVEIPLSDQGIVAFSSSMIKYNLNVEAVHIEKGHVTVDSDVSFERVEAPIDSTQD